MNEADRGRFREARPGVHELLGAPQETCVGMARAVRVRLEWANADHVMAGHALPEEDGMPLSLREQQCLRRIDEQIAASDPRLAAHLTTFGERPRSRRLREVFRGLWRPGLNRPAG